MISIFQMMALEGFIFRQSDIFWRIAKQIQPTHTKANISTKNALYFELGTEWNAEKTEKTPIFAKKSAHNEQL